MKGYPGWFLAAVLGTLLLMFVSGCVLAPTTLVMRFDTDVPWRLPGGGRVLVAAMHAAAGFLAVMLLGSLWTVHMRGNWRRKRQRASGATLGVLLLLLTASAVAIYYAGDGDLGAAASLLHLGAGLGFALPFGWHWAHARRAANSSVGQTPPPAKAHHT